MSGKGSSAPIIQPTSTEMSPNQEVIASSSSSTGALTGTAFIFGGGWRLSRAVLITCSTARADSSAPTSP